MIRRAIGVLGVVAASLAAAVVAALAALAVALAIGPMPMTPLKPTLLSIVSRAVPDMQVTFDAPALRWNPDGRDLEILVTNLDIRNPGGEQLLHVAQAAAAPDVVASLRAGRAVVGRLVLDRPTVAIARQADGGLGRPLLDQQLVQAGSGPGDPWVTAADFLGRVLAPPAADDPLAGIKTLRAQDVQLLLEDQTLQQRIELGAGTLELRRRRGPGEIDARIAIGADGGAGRLDIEVRRMADPERYGLDLRLDNLNPSLLPMAHAQASLREVDVAIDGSLEASLSADGHPSPATFTLRSRPTTLALLDVLSAPVALGPFEVAGSIDSQTRLVRVERLIGAVSGSDVTASGHLILGADGIAGEGEASIRSVDLDDLKGLWPRHLAPAARDWVSQHLRAGSLDQASANVAWLAARGGQPARFDVSGSLSASGLGVDVVDLLPGAQGVGGTADFSQDHLAIELTRGAIQGVRLDGGEVRLTGLGGADARLAADLRIASTVPAALELAQSLPTGIGPSLRVAPGDTQGDATARVRLELPLTGALSEERVRYEVEAQVDQFVVPNVLPGVDLNDGAASVEIKDSVLTGSGKAQLSTVPITLEQLRVDLGPESGPAVGTARLAARLDLAALSILGVEPPSFLGGSADVDMLVDVGGSGQPSARLVADLRQTRVTLPALSVDKRAGQPGRLEADVKIGPAGAVTVPWLTVSMPDIEARGALDISGENHQLSRLDLYRLDLEGSRLRLAIDRQGAGPWSVTMAGERLDLRHLLAGGRNSDDTRGTSGGSAAGVALPNFSLEVELAEVVLPGGSLHALAGTVQRTASRWRRGSVQASLANGHPVRLDLTSTAVTPTHLALTADDAGSLLQTLTSDSRFPPGGTLDLGAEILAEQPVARLEGRLAIRDITVRGTPLLARLLTLASFTGILNTLQGNGIQFARAGTDFALSGGILTLTDGKASGSQVGITAAGAVDLYASTLSLNGTVVPAYSINRLLGSVPIVGRLLRGESGVGAFAATYSVRGPMANPSVAVNPLSVLVPGFIRDLFGDAATAPSTPAPAGP